MPGRRDVVLARFPFTDHSGSKLRPVLVLAEIPGAYRDYVVMFISSQLGQAVPSLDVIVRPSDRAFALTGLKVASVFRIGKVASLSQALIAGTLGQLPMAEFDEVVLRLTRLLTGAPSS